MKNKQYYNRASGLISVNELRDTNLHIVYHVPTILNFIRLLLNFYLISLLSYSFVYQSFNIIAIHILLGIINYLNNFSNTYFLKYTFLSNLVVSGFLNLTLLYFLNRIPLYPNIKTLILLLIYSSSLVFKLLFHLFYVCDCSYKKDDIMCINKGNKVQFNAFEEFSFSDDIKDYKCGDNAKLQQRKAFKDFPVLIYLLENNWFRLVVNSYLVLYTIATIIFENDIGGSYDYRHKLQQVFTVNIRKNEYINFNFYLWIYDLLDTLFNKDNVVSFYISTSLDILISMRFFNIILLLITLVEGIQSYSLYKLIVNKIVK